MFELGRLIQLNQIYPYRLKFKYNNQYGIWNYGWSHLTGSSLVYNNDDVEADNDENSVDMMCKAILMEFVTSENDLKLNPADCIIVILKSCNRQFQIWLLSSGGSL